MMSQGVFIVNTLARPMNATTHIPTSTYESGMDNLF